MHTEPTRLYYIVFRSGGRLNFRWQRSLAMTEGAARLALAEEARAGRPSSMMVEVSKSDTIGLPETFDA